tara:strand:+ start:344 stop:1579 length:1236 start_codon:yes stop_codon:yes gene_type:complete
VTQAGVLSKITVLWFGVFFTLSADDLKTQLGMLSLSPAVLLPVLCLAVFPSVRRTFLNAHLSDRNFSYTLWCTCGFLILMFIQTLLSDWLMRATAEVFKTVLFFLVTHLFFSIISKEKNLTPAIRLSLWTTVIFILYLAYLYLYQFGALFIGNDLDSVDRSGRNQLVLFLFLSVMMSAAFIVSTQDRFSKYIGYIALFLFFLIGALTGSRFGLVFPIIFLIPIVFYYIFPKILNKKFLLGASCFIAVTIPIVLLLWFNQVINIPDGYFISIERLAGAAQSHANSVRLSLLKTGFNCFSDNNILFGHGVKDYLTCVLDSPLRVDLILHNDHLSLLNNVGIIGYFLWFFAIVSYSKVFSISRRSYIFGFGVLIYMLGLLVVDGYNSPIFAIILALSRWEWFNRREIANLKPIV